MWAPLESVELSDIAKDTKPIVWAPLESVELADIAKDTKPSVGPGAVESVNFQTLSKQA